MSFYIGRHRSADPVPALVRDLRTGEILVEDSKSPHVPYDYTGTRCPRCSPVDYAQTYAKHRKDIP